MNTLPNSTSRNCFLAVCVLLAVTAWPLRAQQTLSLEQVLTAVRYDNPSLRAARARWESMLLRVPQARAWEDPMFGVDLERMGTTRLDRVTDAEWMISQQIPISGKNRSRARIAIAEAKTTYEEYRRTYLDLVSRARAAYFRLANAHAQLEINSRNQTLLSQFAQISQVKYETGAKSQSDLLLAQTELLRLNETRLNLERDLAEQQSALNVLMNRPAYAALARPAPLAFVPLPWSREKLEALAQAHRPEIAMAAVRIENAGAQLQLAKRQWIPDPQLRVEAREYSGSGKAIQEYDTGIFFSLPWVNYGKYSAGIAEARRGVESAHDSLEASLNETRGLLRDQLQRIDTYAKNYELFRNNLLPLAQQTIESTRASYEADKTGFLELITTRRTLQDIESSMTDHLANYRIALSELDAMIGLPKPGISADYK